MKKKILKIGLIVGISAIVIGGAVALYMFNMPHRDVQSTNIDFRLSASDLVTEYLNDGLLANDKYLQEEGDSKVLAISGPIKSIAKNLQDNFVILLQDDSPAGVRCTFMISSNQNASELSIGQVVTVKGVIRSGAEYDEDMELYEDVILEKCDII